MTYEPMHSAQAQIVTVKEIISFGCVGHHCRDIPRSKDKCIFYPYFRVKSLCYRQGRINHWANWANAWGLALFGVSRLNTKTLLYWIFMFLGCSPRLKIVELFDYCVYHRLSNLTNLAFIVFEWLKKLNQTESRFMTQELDRNRFIHGRP